MVTKLYVVKYIYFYIFFISQSNKYKWPVFNMCDALAFLDWFGLVVLIYILSRGEQEEIG